MAEDLLTNDTHFSGFKGTLKTANKMPVDGDEIQNIEAGDMFYDNLKEIIYIYSGSAWYGAAATAS